MSSAARGLTSSSAAAMAAVTKGLATTEIRQRRQARIPPLAAAEPLQARPSDGEAIVLGEPPFAPRL